MSFNDVLAEYTCNYQGTWYREQQQFRTGVSNCAICRCIQGQAICDERRCVSTSAVHEEHSLNVFPSRVSTSTTTTTTTTTEAPIETRSSPVNEPRNSGNFRGNDGYGGEPGRPGESGTPGQPGTPGIPGNPGLPGPLPDLSIYTHQLNEQMSSGDKGPGPAAASDYYQYMPAQVGPAGSRGPPGPPGPVGPQGFQGCHNIYSILIHKLRSFI